MEVEKWAQGEAAQELAEEELAMKREERRRRVVQRAAQRLRSRGLAKVLDAWAQGSLDARRLRVRARQVVSKWLRGNVASALNTWRAYGEERARLRAAAGKVVRRCMHRAGAVAWDKWLSWAQEVKQMRGRLGKAMARWAGSCVGKVFNTWKHQAGEEERLRRTGTRIVLRLRKVGAWMGFETWRAGVQERLRIKAVLGTVLGRWQRQQLSRGLTRWVEMSCERRRLRVVMQRVIARISHGVVWRAMHTWAEETERQRHLLKVSYLEEDGADKARELEEAQATAASLEADVRRLEQEIEAAKAASVAKVQALTRQLQEDGTRRLDKGVAEEAGRRIEICKRVVRRMLRQHLWAAFNGYVDGVGASRRMWERAAKVVGRMRHRELAGAFECYVRAVERLTRERERVARTVGKWKTPGLKRVFERWVEFQQLEFEQRSLAAEELARQEFEDVAKKSRSILEAEADRRVRMLEHQKCEVVKEKILLEDQISQERSKHLAELEVAWSETRLLKTQVDALQGEVEANKIAALARAQAIVRKVQTDASLRLGEGAAVLAAKDEELETAKSQLNEAAMSATRLSDLPDALKAKEAEVRKLQHDLASAESAIEHASNALATLNEVKVDNKRLFGDVEEKTRALDEALSAANELEQDIKSVQEEMATLKAASLLKAQELTKQTQQITAADSKLRQELESVVELKHKTVERLEEKLVNLQEVFASEKASTADQISMLHWQLDVIQSTLAQAMLQLRCREEVSFVPGSRRSRLKSCPASCLIVSHFPLTVVACMLLCKRSCRNRQESNQRLQRKRPHGRPTGGENKSGNARS